MCRNFSAASLTAWTTTGWLWPVLHTAMPAMKSRKRLPSTSQTSVPRPCDMTNGIVARVGGGDHLGIARQQRTRLGSGEFGLDVWVRHGSLCSARRIAGGCGPRACARAGPSAFRVRRGGRGDDVHLFGDLKRPAGGGARSHPPPRHRSAPRGSSSSVPAAGFRMPRSVMTARGPAPWPRRGPGAGAVA